MIGWFQSSPDDYLSGFFYCESKVFDPNCFHYAYEVNILCFDERVDRYTFCYSFVMPMNRFNINRKKKSLKMWFFWFII